MPSFYLSYIHTQACDYCKSFSSRTIGQAGLYCRLQKFSNTRMLASWLRAFTDHLTGFLYKQPLLALLSICASIPFLVSLCFCIRSKFFHPLHSIPGPFLAGCSDFFNLYLFASKRVHKKVLALHSKYGKHYLKTNTLFQR